MSKHWIVWAMGPCLACLAAIPSCSPTTNSQERQRAEFVSGREQHKATEDAGPQEQRDERPVHPERPDTAQQLESRVEVRAEFAPDTVPEPRTEPQDTLSPRPDAKSTPERLSDTKAQMGPEIRPEPRPEPRRPPLPTWSDDPCVTLPQHKAGFAATIAAWRKEDTLNPPPQGGVVFVGSSSIRLWRRLQLDFIQWPIIQRGYGGSLLWDTVAYSKTLITAHRPKAVIIYAGTNDIAKGASAQRVFLGYRCLIQRIKQDLGTQTKIAFISVTPNPARWAKWQESAALNRSVQQLSQQWKGLYYIDGASAFLQTGKPPTESLFVSDKLHLNAAGYALWTALIRPALHKIITPPVYTAPSTPPAQGTRVLVDLGPSNPEDGASPSSPDSFGQTWNTWHDCKGGSGIGPGHALGLRDTKGKSTPWRLTTAGQFICNGKRNGGLAAPDSKKLGKIAVSGATIDYFYVTKAHPAGLLLSGLDPSKRYDLRLFASRNTSQETRVTRYTLTTGQGEISQDLQTTGNNIGSDGKYDGNDQTIVSFTQLQPTGAGKLHIEVRATKGAYGYLGLLEITAR